MGPVKVRQSTRSNVAPLLQAMQDEDPEVQLEAATAFGQIGDARAVVALQQA